MTSHPLPSEPDLAARNWLATAKKRLATITHSSADVPAVQAARDAIGDIEAALAAAKPREAHTAADLMAIHAAAFHDEQERCQRCGRGYLDIGWWRAADELWAEITGRADGVGLLCPDCFGRLASDKGIHLRWLPEIDWRDAPPPSPADPAPREPA